MRHKTQNRIPAVARCAALALASSLAGPALAQSGGMDHANMPGMNHGTATPAPAPSGAMDHSSMPSMNHGAATPAPASSGAMDHSNMPGMNHDAAPSPLRRRWAACHPATVRTRAATTPMAFVLT